MKRLLAFLVLCLASPAFGLDATFYFEDSVSAPAAVKSLWIYNLAPTTNGNYLVTRDRVVVKTDSSGSVTVSNLVAGNYQVEFSGQFARTTNWFSFPATNGLVNAKDFRVPQSSDFQAIPGTTFVSSLNATNGTQPAGIVSVSPTTRHGAVVLSIGTNTQPAIQVATNAAKIYTDQVAANFQSSTNGVTAGQATNIANAAVEPAIQTATNAAKIYTDQVAANFQSSTNGVTAGQATNIANAAVAGVVTSPLAEDFQPDQGSSYNLLTWDAAREVLQRVSSLYYDGNDWVGNLKSLIMAAASDETNVLSVTRGGVTKMKVTGAGVITGDGAGVTNVPGSGIAWGDPGTNLWSFTDPEATNINFTIGGDGKISTNQIREPIGGGTGGGQYVAAGTNLSGTTNGSTVTLSATPSTLLELYGSYGAATNGGTITVSITNSPGWSLVDTNLGVSVHTNASGQFWLSSTATNAGGVSGVTASGSATATTNGSGVVDINVTGTGGDVTAAQLLAATNQTYQAGTNWAGTAKADATNAIYTAATGYADAATNSLSGVMTTRITAATNDLNTTLRGYVDAATNQVLGTATSRVTAATNGAYSSATAYTDAATNQALGTATSRVTAATNGAYSSAAAYTDAATNQVLGTATTRITSATNDTYQAGTNWAGTAKLDATNALWTAAAAATNDVLATATSRVTAGTNGAYASAVAYTLASTNTVLTDATNRAKAYADSVAGAGWSLVDTNLGVSIITNAGSKIFLASSAAVMWTGGQTNQGSVTLNMQLKWQGFATNADFAISGLSNVDTSLTNVQQTSVILTNTGAGTRAFTVPASWIISGGATQYLTNQGVLAVCVYPGLGTNAAWKCLK